jgi:hypothetical protein
MSDEDKTTENRLAAAPAWLNGQDSKSEEQSPKTRKTRRTKAQMAEAKGLTVHTYESPTHPLDVEPSATILSVPEADWRTKYVAYAGFVVASASLGIAIAALLR